MELIQQAYTAMMTGVIVVLAVLIVISIIRSILGRESRTGSWRSI